ncbi:MAG TPA: type II secretion system protein GspG, partial [Planctomycetota bacterium]|nr:type II secretion system protein GspG [Planctomycetota bacterium]
VLADVKDGGTERVGEIQARVIEYSIRLEEQVWKVRLFVDPATKRPLRKEIADEGAKSIETYTAFTFDEALPDSEFSFASPRRLARVRAAQVAKSVELYGLYTGRFPLSLDDLAARPAHLEPEVFWPEGGFALGGVVPKDPWGRPYGLRAERGRAWVMSLGSDGAPGGSAEAEDHEVAVGPVTRRPVGAPTDRLCKQYTARIQVQLLAAAVRAFRDATGELPRRKAALWETPDQVFLAGGKVPLDPWGSPYRIISDPGQVRVLVRDPKERALALKQLTADEKKQLESVARPRLGDDERRSVSALLDRLSEDDLEAREKAESELKAWGPAIASLLEERLKSEKDGEARLRVEQVRKAVPARRPAWMRELAALQLTLGANESVSTEGALLTACQHNLSQLWKMECVYMSQFGGKLKKMPDATGKDFWLALVKTMPPLIDETENDSLVCPASGIAVERGVCTYRGPARPVSRLADGDFVGMCDDEAHGEQIVVLRKSGDTMVVPRGGAEHDEALRTTAP